jgi:hypothetical protein
LAGGKPIKVKIKIKIKMRKANLGTCPNDAVGQAFDVFGRRSLSEGDRRTYEPLEMTQNK